MSSAKTFILDKRKIVSLRNKFKMSATFINMEKSTICSSSTELISVSMALLKCLCLSPKQMVLKWTEVPEESLRKEQLLPLLKHIRFPIMDMEELEEIPQKVLDLEEIKAEVNKVFSFLKQGVDLYQLFLLSRSLSLPSLSLCLSRFFFFFFSEKEENLNRKQAF